MTPQLPNDTGRCAYCLCFVIGHEPWGQRRCRTCKDCIRYMTVAEAAHELNRDLDDLAGEA